MSISNVFILVSESVLFLQVSNAVFKPSSEVTVSWSKPNGGDEIDQYHVKWYQQGKNQHIGYDIEHEPGKINYSFTISNLRSGTQYIVLVAAKNSEGYGAYKSANIVTGTYRLLWFEPYEQVHMQHAIWVKLIVKQRENINTIPERF